MINEIRAVCLQYPNNELSSKVLYIINNFLAGKLENKDFETLKDKVDKIIQEIQEISGINEHQFFKSRFLEHRYYRYYLAYYLRLHGFGLNNIGRILRKDHSTIMFNIQEMENLFERKDNVCNYQVELVNDICNKYFC